MIGKLVAALSVNVSRMSGIGCLPPVLQSMVNGAPLAAEQGAGGRSYYHIPHIRETLTVPSIMSTNEVGFNTRF